MKPYQSQKDFLKKIDICIQCAVTFRIQVRVGDAWEEK
jgi:hypothetical protein